MSLILQIETATSCCSVAVAKDGIVMACEQVNERNLHSKVITNFVADVVLKAGITLDEIDAIAVSSGPGSYTGLRIGISTAKGLCFALDKPLIAVETLEAMAFGIINTSAYNPGDDVLLCPMIDARRMEVYTAIFKNDGSRLRQTSAEIITGESFADLLNNNRVLFFGDGAEKCEDTLDKNSNALFLPRFVNSAAYLTEKALEKFRAQQFENVAYFEPYYLKDFIAGKKSV